MGQIYNCDGCGKTDKSIAPFTVRGHVLKAIYCAECLPKVDEFLKGLDDLHSKTAKAFQKALTKLRKKYSEGDFILPDGGNIKVEEKVTEKEKKK